MSSHCVQAMYSASASVGSIAKAGELKLRMRNPVNTMILCFVSTVTLESRSTWAEEVLSLQQSKSEGRSNFHLDGSRSLQSPYKPKRCNKNRNFEDRSESGMDLPSQELQAVSLGDSRVVSWIDVPSQDTSGQQRSMVATIDIAARWQ